MKIDPELSFPFIIYTLSVKSASFKNSVKTDSMGAKFTLPMTKTFWMTGKEPFR